MNPSSLTSIELAKQNAPDADLEALVEARVAAAELAALPVAVTKTQQPAVNPESCAPLAATVVAFLVGAVVALALLLTGEVANAAHDHHHHMPSKDKPAGHGMLMVGTDSVYLSHLPMFHSPHDYQVIFKAKISALKVYQEDKAANPQEPVYTLDPERFVLPDMVKNPRPFKATIYRGHFERGGQPIAENVTVEIETIVHFAKFDPKAVKPATTSYLLFGGGSELFLAHVITAKPDFDHVLSIGSAKGLAPMVPGQPAVKMQARHPNGTPFDPKKPIALEGPQGSAVIESMQQIYLEFGDLAH